MGEAVMISEGEGDGQSLPSMVLRVLLVEADDCTRHIISALLRKCSYKVTAVPDGLKAWETLRESSHNIDLVLTEVDLPSISGYALLTLIVEHDMCKNIPVIMMSSQDSISTVLKCMVKGAADFLIKPIRKNELRNLWQHVWRRKIQGAGSCPQNKALENPKSVHVSENEIASNYSSDNQPSAQTGNEKASGAHVLEHEECVEMVDRSVDPNRKSIDNMTSSGMGTSSGIEPYSSVDISSDEDALYAEARAMVAEVEQEFHRKNTCTVDEVYSASCTEAFDYIGKFEDFLGQSYDGNAKSNVGSRLGLCMKTFDPGCSIDEWSGEQNMISHSKASAFSKYENKITLQHPYCTREHGGSLTEYQQNTSTLTFSTSEVQITEPFGDSRVHSEDNAAETVNGKLITAEKARCDSAVCESSDLGSGVTNKLSSSPSGSNSDEAIESSLLVSSPGRALVSESVNNGSLLQDKTRAENHNTSQREAALLKFRLKRKDRCFDKKVRYQSRKRLAEQRPRVKGQFVRQLKNENQPEGQR